VANGLALAAELDRRAVIQDEPTQRGLADCVRLLCLPLPRDATYFEEYAGSAKRSCRPFI